MSKTKDLICPVYFAKNKTSANTYIKAMVVHIKEKFHVDEVEKPNLNVTYPIMIMVTIFESSYRSNNHTQLNFQKLKVSKKMIKNIKEIL